ncbi:MAG: glycosyltransferase [Deltaproteobacteria bacterium]|nr:glycosyltransferase [Deltaproteobacteria bacterium]
MAARFRMIELPASRHLDDYALVEGQGPRVAPFLAQGRELARHLGTSRVWMVNSTASGGGVAEMLPHTCGLLREAGLDVRWLVLEPDDHRFFAITKGLHHKLHGRHGAIELDDDAAGAFAQVSAEAARALIEHLEPGDVVVVHDPQPCGLAALLPAALSSRLVWRCHVGVPFENEHTEAAWAFLQPLLEPYHALVFTSERYVPARWKPRSVVIQPAIDPLSHKNRELAPYKLLGILRSAGLLDDDEAPRWARFASRASRWLEGRFESSALPRLLSSPVILQVSRFDRLKGFERAIAAFRVLAENGLAQVRRLRAPPDRADDEIARSQLVLAGPDPSGVADDPEALAVLEDLCRRRDALPPAIAARVHIVKLPMVDARENALMVNALQRMASLIVQPSVEEGFGLTVTEALWKAVPVVASNVGGIAQQIRPGIDGLIVDDADDADAFAAALLRSLVLTKVSERMARSGRRRVAELFLSVREATQWLDVIEKLVVQIA